MTKPSTILRQEFVEKIVNLINGSDLPAFVLVDVVEELLQELRRLAAEQYKRDMQAWEEYQKTEAEKSESVE